MFATLASVRNSWYKHFPRPFNMRFSTETNKYCICSMPVENHNDTVLLKKVFFYILVQVGLNTWFCILYFILYLYPECTCMHTEVWLARDKIIYILNVHVCTLTSYQLEIRLFISWMYMYDRMSTDVWLARVENLCIHNKRVHTLKSD